MDWQQNKRNSDSELNDFFLSTVPAQYFRPNDSENGDDSTKNCLATNVIITSPGRCAFTQRLMNNVYSFYRETSYHYFDWFVCLFVLRLNVPVNNFSVMSGRSHRFLGN